MRTVQSFLVLMGADGLTSWLSARSGAQMPVVPIAPDQPAALLVSIAVPESPSSIALFGEAAIETKFPTRTGSIAAGQEDVDPPLIHKNHEPSNRGTKTFPLAMALGIRQHDRPFANVPLVEGLTREDVTMITAHVRELQRANCIN